MTIPEPSSDWTQDERLRLAGYLLDVAVAAHERNMVKLSSRCLYRVRNVLRNEATMLENARADLMFYARVVERPGFPWLSFSANEAEPPADHA